MKIKAIKENNRWFVDEDNGFSKEQNELVVDIPKIIELFSDSEKVEIEFSIEHFENSQTFRLLKTNEIGSDYRLLYKGKSFDGWLCPVFFYYFEEAPETLYFSVRRI